MWQNMSVRPLSSKHRHTDQFILYRSHFFPKLLSYFIHRPITISSAHTIYHTSFCLQQLQPPYCRTTVHTQFYVVNLTKPWSLCKEFYWSKYIARKITLGVIFPISIFYLDILPVSKQFHRSLLLTGYRCLKPTDLHNSHSNKCY